MQGKCSLAAQILRQYNVSMLAVNNKASQLTAGVSMDADDMGLVQFYQAMRSIESVGYSVKVKKLKISGSLISIIKALH